jgi:hypothetical protein
MGTTTVRYTKLPGTGYRYLVPPWAIVVLFFIIGIFVLLLRGKRVELWLGADHLLLVEWDGYREYYKRFRFREIQAVVVRKTGGSAAITAVLGALIAFLIILVASIAPAQEAYPFLIIFGALAVLFFAVNLALGPTCRCELRTAVQTLDLPSLRRLRDARKMLARLAPLVESAQAALAPATQSPAILSADAAPASMSIEGTKAASPETGPSDLGAPT